MVLENLCLQSDGIRKSPVSIRWCWKIFVFNQMVLESLRFQSDGCWKIFVFNQMVLESLRFQSDGVGGSRVSIRLC